MTNINCSYDCVHQSDGKCCMDNMATAELGVGNNECIYYVPQKTPQKPIPLCN